MSARMPNRMPDKMSESMSTKCENGRFFSPRWGWLAFEACGGWHLSQAAFWLVSRACRRFCRSILGQWVEFPPLKYETVPWYGPIARCKSPTKPQFFFGDSEIGKRWTFSMISWGFAMFAFRVSGDQNIGKWESGGDSCTHYSSIPSTIKDVTIFGSSFGPQLVMGKRVIGSHLIKHQQTQTSNRYVL